MLGVRVTVRIRAMLVAQHTPHLDIPWPILCRVRVRVRVRVAVRVRVRVAVRVRVRVGVVRPVAAPNEQRFLLPIVTEKHGGLYRMQEPLQTLEPYLSTVLLLLACVTCCCFPCGAVFEPFLGRGAPICHMMLNFW